MYFITFNWKALRSLSYLILIKTFPLCLLLFTLISLFLLLTPIYKSNLNSFLVCCPNVLDFFACLLFCDLLWLLFSTINFRVSQLWKFTRKNRRKIAIIMINCSIKWWQDQVFFDDLFCTNVRDKRQLYAIYKWCLFFLVTIHREWEPIFVLIIKCIRRYQLSIIMIEHRDFVTDFYECSIRYTFSLSWYLIYVTLFLSLMRFIVLYQPWLRLLLVHIPWQLL